MALLGGRALFAGWLTRMERTAAVETELLSEEESVGFEVIRVDGLFELVAADVVFAQLLQDFLAYLLRFYQLLHDF